ncbi:membrane fusion protein (multidrug efflux system) [Algoriphagus sp. 4150]|uniref:efflux RND transporter periplasmic adaptor subunit n=1 Tax=Algoriphagus sp. 4150 TaxID=2817756 RepID=UPI00285F7420|nr:efflux RND transporter periplasmic adaptor subunit [Algoriphagus sp. 4150]MDR7129310.1 membrane fusion protein (multidrug efflux system) [Algoriphagus sp. 4150]
MKYHYLFRPSRKTLFTILTSVTLSALAFGCKKAEVEEEGIPLPILTLKEESAALAFNYLGSIEGVENVQIRPQVEGILEAIYVDEGQYVKKGDPLFKINSQPYMEDLKNAQANVELEKARLKKAQTEINRLRPLIDNEVISEVRMETTLADYEVAQSSLAKAEAAAANMQINMNFTTISAPVDGLMGRIPKSIGNVVKKTDDAPLTTLSNVREIYVYFSMSESDYLYYERMKKDSTSKRMNPDVKLVLADGSIYDKVGKIDANSGQISRSTGSITLRAHFDNPDTLLRTGNTGKILMEQIYPNAILIPQSATTTIQDKRFIFLLNDDNTVAQHEITIEGRSGTNYIVSGNTLKPNDRIVTAGLDKLSEGVLVNPLEQGKLLSDN